MHGLKDKLSCTNIYRFILYITFLTLQTLTFALYYLIILILNCFNVEFILIY